MTQGKFKNRPLIIEGKYFPSQLEGKTYRLLKSLCTQKNLILYTQYKIRLNPLNNKFPPIYWRCDFAITAKDNTLLYLIESKGKLLPEFKYVIVLLDQFPDLISKLIITNEDGDFSQYGKQWESLQKLSLKEVYVKLSEETELWK